ncbi:MAG: protoheme IX farnesyltransferase [Bacteroidota bacterium]|nr:protoheme IX farnesyltransferase [Bacteroidota bacterium]
MEESNFITGLKDALTLIKYKVSAAVTFTTITGYLIYSGRIDAKLFYTAIGVFLLAGGSSALNQIQERNTDGLMERTKHRPLPSGKITLHAALIISVSMMVSGGALLFFLSGTGSFCLGFFNVFWYNLVYTYLKRITPFAVIPGSLVGAIPVIIGWTAAGGEMMTPRILFVAYFVFIWQIPHFWFLLLKYGGEYDKAGLPSISKVLSQQSLKNLTYIWIVATSATSLLFPLFHIVTRPLLLILMLILNIWLITAFTKITFSLNIGINFKAASATLNLFMLVILLLLMIEALIV